VTEERLPRDVVAALAALWCSSYGPAADLVSFLKKNPGDPRAVDVPKIEPLLTRFLARWNEHDISGATVISAEINRAMFNCNARELAPLVKKGREFSGRRKGINPLTKAIDGALDRLGSSASTEEIKRDVRNNPIVTHVDIDGSLEWTDHAGKERTITQPAFENRVSQRRRKKISGI
jgi:hypothetical protein